MTDDESREMIDRHSNVLAEHFDSVQILATRLNSDGTTSAYARGSGNWYARQASAREFVNRAQADEIGRSVAENLPESL